MTTMAMTLAPLAPDTEATLQSTSQALAEYLSPEAHGMELRDEGDLAIATSIINDIKFRAKALEELEKSVTAPILKGVEQYRSFFRPRRQDAVDARNLWGGKIVAYVARRAEAQRAAEAALQQAITTGDAPAAAAAVTALVPAERTQGLALQDSWEFEERNHAIVPTSLTVTHRPAVLAEIKRQMALGVAEPAIPGLRVFKTQIVKAVGR